MTRSKRDANERAILDDLHRLGVWYRQMPRETGFDLILGFRGQLHMVEIKDPAQPPSACRLTPNEEATRAQVERMGVAYHVCGTLAEVLRALNA